MNVIILIAWWFVGAAVGLLVSFLITWYIDHRYEVRRKEAQKRRQEIRRDVLALRSEYDERISNVTLALVAEWSDSVDEARRKLDDEVRSHDEIEELFGPGSEYLENLRRKWGDVLST